MINKNLEEYLSKLYSKFTTIFQNILVDCVRFPTPLIQLIIQYNRRLLMLYSI